MWRPARNLGSWRKAFVPRRQRLFFRDNERWRALGTSSAERAEESGNADEVEEEEKEEERTQYTPDLLRLSHLREDPNSWLAREMRSNHAGETGAVRIYEGATFGLKARKKLAWRSQHGKENAISISNLGAPDSSRSPHASSQTRAECQEIYERDAHRFASTHAKTESQHLEWLNSTFRVAKSFDGKERAFRPSVLLPLWHVAGFSLGFVSTFFSPRFLYVTTDAVESFVERHYNQQIERLTEELQVECGAGEGMTEVSSERDSNQRQEKEEEDEKAPRRSHRQTLARIELLRLLRAAW